MRRLKKMDQERLAEAVGARLDLTANMLRSPEVPTGSHAPKKQNPEEGLDRSGSEDLQRRLTMDLQRCLWNAALKRRGATQWIDLRETNDRNDTS